MAAGRDIRAGRAFIELALKGGEKVMAGLRAARQQLKDFGSAMQALGRVMAATAGAMAVPFGASVKVFAGFDDKMREVKAVSQATGDEFVRLADKAKKLGASTSFTAVEVAGLMAELGRAGFNPGQIEAMTAAVLDLARATSTDATLASGIMAASIRQFGLQAGDATRVADALTAAANKSFNTVEQLGEALSYAGPVAADFGMSIEETVAILGTLGNVGIQASNAGTALRRMLTLSGAEADNMQKIFGVSFQDASKNARPLVDVLAEVADATKNMGSAERAQKFNEAFGLLGITGASAVSKNVASTRELLDAIESAGGVARATAKEMDAGIGGSFRMFLSAVEGVGIAIGEALNDDLKRVSDLLQAIAARAIDFVNANKDVIVTVVKVGAAVGAAGGIFLGLGLAATVTSTAIGGIVSVVGLASAALGLLLSPVVLIGAALIGAGAGWLKFSAAGQQATGSIRGAIKRVMDAVAPIVQTFRDTFSGVLDAIQKGNWDLAGQIAVTGLKTALLQGIASIATSVGGVWGDFVGTLGQQILNGDLQGAWNTLLVGLHNAWANLWEGVVALAVQAANKIIDVWEGISTTLMDGLIEASAAGGIRGKVASMIIGTDLNAEIEKDIEELRKLYKERDELMATKGPLTDAQKKRGAAMQDRIDALEKKSPVADMLRGGRENLKSDFAAPRAALDDFNRAAQEGTQAAAAAMGEAAQGGSEAAEEAARAAKAELDSLREQAARQRAEQEAAGGGGKPGSGGAGGSGGGDGASEDSKGGGVEGAFGHARAQGLGGTRGPMERTASATEKTAKAAEKIAANTDPKNGGKGGAAAPGGMLPGKGFQTPEQRKAKDPEAAADEKRMSDLDKLANQRRNESPEERLKRLQPQLDALDEKIGALDPVVKADEARAAARAAADAQLSDRAKQEVLDKHGPNALEPSEQMKAAQEKERQRKEALARLQEGREAVQREIDAAKAAKAATPRRIEGGKPQPTLAELQEAVEAERAAARRKLDGIQLGGPPTERVAKAFSEAKSSGADRDKAAEQVADLREDLKHAVRSVLQELREGGTFA